MEPRYIVCDPELCTGCRLCEFACSAAKLGLYDLELSRIRNARPEPQLTLSIACHLCADAPCIAACPRQALSSCPERGIILIDQVKCTGCSWCIEVCDFGAIALDLATKSVVICDLCPDLPRPRCLEFCPKEALSLMSPEAVAQRARNKAARGLAGDT